MANIHFLALLAFASGPAFAQMVDRPAAEDPMGDAVARFACASPLSSGQETSAIVDAAYGRRSIAIVRAGLVDDMSRLSVMIAPEAQIRVNRGDEVLGPRSAGAGAVAEWVRTLRPKSFHYVVESSGTVATNPCGDARATITLQGSREGQVVEMEFRYRNGLLVRGLGREVRVETGSFSPPGTP